MPGIAEDYVPWDTTTFSVPQVSFDDCRFEPLAEADLLSNVKGSDAGGYVVPSACRQPLAGGVPGRNFFLLPDFDAAATMESNVSPNSPMPVFGGPLDMIRESCMEIDPELCFDPSVAPGGDATDREDSPGLAYDGMCPMPVPAERSSPSLRRTPIAAVVSLRIDGSQPSRARDLRPRAKREMALSPSPVLELRPLRKRLAGKKRAQGRRSRSHDSDNARSSAYSRYNKSSKGRIRAAKYRLKRRLRFQMNSLLESGVSMEDGRIRTILQQLEENDT